MISLDYVNVDRQNWALIVLHPTFFLHRFTLYPYSFILSVKKCE